MCEEEQFKDFLLKNVREDFDIYWWIENWIEEKWEEFKNVEM